MVFVVVLPFAAVIPVAFVAASVAVVAAAVVEFHLLVYCNAVEMALPALYFDLLAMMATWVLLLISTTAAEV